MALPLALPLGRLVAGKRVLLGWTAPPSHFSFFKNVVPSPNMDNHRISIPYRSMYLAMRVCVLLLTRSALGAVNLCEVKSSQTTASY